MTHDSHQTGDERDGRHWRMSEFVGLIFFLVAAAVILPLVRDSYILQDVWVAICGVIGLD